MALLGLDIGTSATKALVLTPQGKVVATAESTHVLKTPRPGWSEQHPEDWWRAVVLATGHVLKKAGIHGSEITAIGLSGQMHGSVFWGMVPSHCARLYFGMTNARLKSAGKLKRSPAGAKA